MSLMNNQVEPSVPPPAVDGGPDVSSIFTGSVVSSLSAHIQGCLTDAVQHKQNVIQRALACERQRNGEYSPAMKQLIAETGGQEIFMMLTDIKSRAADSWIKDVMLNHNESTWSLRASVEPELPDELKQEITSVVVEEAAMVAAQGIPVSQEVMREREREITEEAQAKVVEEAERRAARMEKRIVDKLEEGNWRTTLTELIYDFTTYPAVILKGPVLRKKQSLAWGEGFQPIVEERTIINVDRVSFWDAFPSPGAVSIQDGFFIQRHRLSRKAVYSMRSMPGASQPSIEAVLNTYRKGTKTNLVGDSDHENIMGNDVTWKTDGMIEVFEFWGPAAGYMLLDWGIQEFAGQPIDPLDEYQINAWKCGPYILRAQLNPDPLGQRPYSKACFEDIPGQFWGKALPEMMADVQVMCNAAARALANNMGIASGPQVEVHTDRLPAGTQLTTMRPWKIWQTLSDKTGNGQPAVRFFQPSMNSGELLQIYSHFAKVADEVTGVPNYIYGSSNVSGAGRTSSGLAMLMENAAKGIKHAILNLDQATSAVVKRTYVHLMMYDPDPSIKGDVEIVAAGAIGAMLREQQLNARREFMAETLNPVDAQIIGPEGRAYMLREVVKGLFTEVNKIVPSPEKLRAQMMAQQAQAEAQAMAAAQTKPEGQDGPPQTNTSQD